MNSKDIDDGALQHDGNDVLHDARDTASGPLSGAEHFLVGISPQYWSHTPMNVQFLHQLGLVEGIDCFVVKKLTNECQHGIRESNELKWSEKDEEASQVTRMSKSADGDNKKSNAPRNEGEVRFIPVSKCELQGVLVNAERKSNGACHYLLDDGTGVVDCIAWADNAMYSLPPLVPQNEERLSCRVGDIVRVFGKIRCLSIGRVRETMNLNGRIWEIRDCAREVQVTSISPLQRFGERRSASVDTQSNHWLRCLQFERRALIGGAAGVPMSGSTGHCNYLEQNSVMAEPVRNGSDVLSLLGSEIASKAVQRTDFPATDDAYGAWRVFGVGCQCDLPYKDSLLYCHCQATVVPLDPHFKFRDVLLNLLLEMEAEASCSWPTDPSNSQLHFQYKSIVSNSSLQAVATQIVSKDSKVAVSVDQLFLKTFGALRKDGIISLLDNASDTYLLISRKHVIDPYCRKIMAKTSSSFLERRILESKQRTYLSNVTSARIQYVKKMLLGGE
jgi:hypothetical protein